MKESIKQYTDEMAEKYELTPEQMANFQRTVKEMVGKKIREQNHGEHLKKIKDKRRAKNKVAQKTRRQNRK